MSYVGKKVVVRAKNAGVFFGTIVEKTEKSVKMKNVRKLWYWDGACAVEEIAQTGVAKPENCKFTVTVSEMEINDWEQILPATEEAIKSIEGVIEWKKK
jgi:hypothetical protein